MGDGRERVLEGHARTVGPAPDGGEVTLQREGGVRGEGRGAEERGGEGRGGGRGTCSYGGPGSRWR